MPKNHLATKHDMDMSNNQNSRREKFFSGGFLSLFKRHSQAFSQLIPNQLSRGTAAATDGLDQLETVLKFFYIFPSNSFSLLLAVRMALGLIKQRVVTLCPLLLLATYLLLQAGIPSADGIPVEEDLRLTVKERRALDKFKPRVMKYLPHDYMKNDIYLIRWLRARNLNIQQAERMLFDNLRWRRENKMDTINDEDWTDMTEQFGFNYTLDTVDKAGRPIGAANIGNWDVRPAILAGKGQRGMRFIEKCMEEAFQEVIKLQRQGKNVTQWKNLFNLEGFNLINQGCPLCLPIYLQIVNSHELHYPGFADAIIFFNAPPSLQVIIGPLLQIVGDSTRRAVKVLGTNKREWQKYLDSEISRDQRTPEYGGTKRD